jgi:deoxyribonuclease V
MKWPENIQDARAMQEFLCKEVRIVPYRGRPCHIAGVDASFTKDRVVAAACLFSFPALTCLERVSSIQIIRFPYVPGYLAFREGPAIITAVKKLMRRPDIILVDGQGIAHPRQFGIACHIGVLLDIPTIGCAKTRLVGEYREPGTRKGAWSALRYGSMVVGTVLRTRDGVRPLFVSPGHRIDRSGAIRLVLACAGKYRIPEPLRCADAHAGHMAK